MTPAEAGRLLLTFYGDDFTGSTDVMEALNLAGVPTVLFLRPPTPDDLRRHPDARAVGVAGVSRSLPTDAIEAELRPVFDALRALNAPLVHYKVCSTFDSSPQIGSIGRAIDIGQSVFGSPCVPLVVGAPRLGRFVVFGHLFARVRIDEPTVVYRLDRHPTMSRHPVTPMDEADLLWHLSRQTANPMIGLNVLTLEGSGEEAEARLHAAVQDGSKPVVLFDTLTEEHLGIIGGLLWHQTTSTETLSPLFTVGSSGVEYALTAHWRAEGLLPAPPTFTPGAVGQIAVVSGSCSSVTDRQIQDAVENADFAEVALDATRFMDPRATGREEDRAADAARAALATGRPGVILHTSRGPEDARVAAVASLLGAGGADEAAAFGPALGGALGRILRRLIEDSGIRRAVVCGGDTSGYVARALNIAALTMAGPAAPGSPLCRIAAEDEASRVNGVEIVFKGGQVGKAALFEQVRQGTA